MANEKIENYLAEIDRLIEEAKNIPFSNKIGIDQDELVEIIQSIRENMPTEIIQAKRVAQNSTDIIRKAERNAEEIIETLEGIRCGFKSTSCPDQLAAALKEALNN